MGTLLIWQHVVVTRALRPVGFARFNAVVAFVLLAGSVAVTLLRVGG